jgi:hypothetical protein
MQPKRIIQHISLEETIEDVDLPPSHLKATFKTLRDWLSNICESKRPQKPITKFLIGLFESPDDRILFLIGLNTYDKKVAIDFEPENMYFLLPKTEYNSLNREQLSNKLTIELTKFIKTKKFETSFLAESNSITFDDRVVIWSK